MASDPGDSCLDVHDPASMRAMAHPARLAALQRLINVDAATATDLAEVTGLTASAMSYHLRSLKRAGLVETAPSRGDGRERLWRSVHRGYSVASAEGSERVRQASRDLVETLLAVQEMRVRAWLASDDEPGWLDTGYFGEFILTMTLDEMRELGDQLVELLEPYRRGTRTDPPVGARSMVVVFRGFPVAAKGL